MWTKRIWKCITPIFVYVLVSLTVSFLATLVISFQVMSEMGVDFYKAMNDSVYYEEYLTMVTERTQNNILLITALSFLAMAPILIGMNLKDRKKIKMPNTSMPIVSWASLAVLGATLCIALNGILELTSLSALLGDSYQDTATAIYSADLVLQYITVGVLAPISEELIFRGLMYKRMRTFLMPALAIMISAVAFGLYHGNLLQFLYAMILGFFLAYIYEAFRTVVAPILVHAGANLVSVVVSNNEEVQLLLAQDRNRYLISTIICIVLATVCLGGILLVRQSQQQAGKEQQTDMPAQE